MTDISDEDLLAAAAEVLGDAPEAIDDDPIIDDEPIVDEDVEAEPEEDEPEKEFAASMSYDEYIEKGLPPEKYMGPEALESFRKMVGDRKGYRDSSNEFKALNARLDADANARTQAVLQDQREQQQSKIAALEAQIAESKDALDTDGLQKALEAKHKLSSDLERTNAQAAPQQEHSVVQSYRHINTQLNDPAYEAQFIEKFNGRIAQLTTAASDNEIGRLLNEVADEIKGSAPQAPPRRTAPRVASSRGASNGAGSAAQKAVAKMSKETQGLYKTWANGSDLQKEQAKQLIEDFS